MTTATQNAPQTAPEAATGPKPRTPKVVAADAATALFERKLQMAATLTCNGLIADIERADDELADLMSKKSVLDLDIQALRAKIGDMEDMAALSVVGKNESDRKAQRVLVLQSDSAVQEVSDALRHEQSDVAELEVSIKKIERRVKRLEKTVDYRISVLRYLGG